MEKTITLLNGSKLQIDGTLQSLLLQLHKQISLDNKMVYSTQQLADEIKSIITQFDEQERANYLAQSLIVNFKFYEKEMIKEVYEKNKTNHKNN